MSELPPPNTQLLVSGSGAVYMQNLAVQGNSIIATNTDGSVNFVPNGNGVIGFGDVGFNNGVISTTITDLDIVLTPDGNGTVKTGNLQLTGNTISSTDTDGDLLLAPNGNGNVGIGASNPATRLHIYKSEDTTSVIYPLRIEAHTDGSNVSDGNSGVGMDFVANRGSTAQQLASQIYSQVYSGAGTAEDHWSLNFNVRADDTMYNAMVIAAVGGNANPGANVGIGTTSPGTRLQVNGYQTFYDSTLLPGFNSSGDKVPAKIILGNEYGPQIRTFYPNGRYTDAVDLEFWTCGQNIATDNMSSRLIIKAQSGNIGIGTSDPRARVHINGAGSGSGLNSGQYRRFDYSNSGLVASSGGWSAADLSIWALNSIISRQSIASHSNGSFSDERIKKNIIDINDGEALDVIRQIQPKKYEYKDTVMKGTKPVWGFIAQEVGSVLDYSTDLMEKEIPNIYSNATIQGKTLMFENFDTSNLVRDNEGNICKKLFLMSEKDTEVTVTIDTIINNNSITILEDIEQQNLFENIIFVYGQYVKDFHVLKKDAIFTVGIAALQEVDRRQTMDNERILELEGELALVKEENNLLKQQLDSILGRLSAAGL